MKKVFQTKDEAQKHVRNMKAVLRSKGIVIDNIPDYIKERNQWVVWGWSVTDSRDGFQTTKIPINCINGKKASHSDPNTWSSFDKAIERYNQNTEVSGIGYVFSKDDDLVGVDFDNCIAEDKQIHPEILQIIEKYECYMEASPSMTGLKVIGFGNIPEESLNTEAGSGFKIHNFPIKNMDIEVYQHSRFFTVTTMKLKSKPSEIGKIQGMVQGLSIVKSGGKPDFQVSMELEESEESNDKEVMEHIEDSQYTGYTPQEVGDVDDFGNPVIDDSEENIVNFSEEQVQESDISKASRKPNPSSPNPSSPNPSSPNPSSPNPSSPNPSSNGHHATSVSVVDKIMNSKQAPIFRTLYFEGDTASYPSHSEADLALTSILCWWCQGNRMEAETIFSSSKLVREKWEKRTDYRNGLWDKANTGEYYMPRELADPKDLPPISALERQIDVVSKWLKESDSYNQSAGSYVLPDTVRYDGHKVILDCMINKKSVPRLLVSDYICIGLGITPMSLWKRDSNGKFTDPNSKIHWRDVNNFAAEIVGNTGGWGNAMNRHSAAAEAALEAIGL